MENNSNDNTLRPGSQRRPENADDSAGSNGHGNGVKAFLDGLSYQQMLMISITCHAYNLKKSNKEFDFKMSSEDPEGGKFDDIGFQFMENNRWSHIYIQAKHKDNTSNTITWNDLLSTEINAPFSIRPGQHELGGDCEGESGCNAGPAAAVPQAGSK